jgi:hypothetical protein
MIEEAIVDADTESEQAGGFHTMIEQELEAPFETAVHGVTVVVKVDITEAGEIAAVCQSSRALDTLKPSVPSPTDSVV